MTALKQVYYSKSLLSSWRRIYKRTGHYNKSVAGIDSESVSDFSINTDSKLNEISKTILTTKSFNYSFLRPVLVKKKNGKDRLICVPTVRDRIVQGAILAHLSKDNRYGLDNNVSFGFILGKGVRSAVIRAKTLREEKPFVYKTDITSFFDSMDRDILKEAIRKRIRERSLHQLLFGALECEIEPTKGHMQRRIIALGIKNGRGVRQGMPLSPFFSNLILSDFDRTIANRGIHMVRYADDLVIFANSIEECKDIHGLVKSELLYINLTIPDIEENSKTIIYLPDEAAEFLGLDLVIKEEGCRLELSTKQIDSIREKMLQLSNLDSLLEKRITITKFSRKLDNIISGYEGAYHICDNYEIVKDSMRSWRRKTIEGLFKKGFNLNVEKLTQKQKDFLEIN